MHTGQNNDYFDLQLIWVMKKYGVFWWYFKCTLHMNCNYIRIIWELNLFQFLFTGFDTSSFGTKIGFCHTHTNTLIANIFTQRDIYPRPRMRLVKNKILWEPSWSYSVRVFFTLYVITFCIIKTFSKIRYFCINTYDNNNDHLTLYLLFRPCNRST